MSKNIALAVLIIAGVTSAFILYSQSEQVSGVKVKATLIYVSEASEQFSVHVQRTQLQHKPNGTVSEFISPYLTTVTSVLKSIWAVSDAEKSGLLGVAGVAHYAPTLYQIREQWRILILPQIHQLHYAHHRLLHQYHYRELNWTDTRMLLADQYVALALPDHQEASHVDFPEFLKRCIDIWPNVPREWVFIAVP